MCYLFKSSLQKFIVVIYLSKFALTQWISLNNGTINIPAHTFSIYLASDEILTGSLTWNYSNNKTDLDIYIYENGQDITVKDNKTASYISSILNYQNFTFKSNSSNLYFVRVYPYNLSSIKLFTYNLKLTTSSTTVSYTGIFVEKYEKYNSIIIPNNTLSITNIGFKYQTNSILSNQAALISQSFIIYVSSNYVLIICNNSLSDPDNWIFIIKDTLTSAYSLTNVSYNLLYYQDYAGCPSECLQNSIWNNATKKCQQIITKNISQHSQKNNQINNSDTSLIILIVSVLSPFILLAIILTSIFLWSKCKKLQTENKFRETSRQFNETQHQIKEEQNCCICMGENCDYTMKCKHIFHKKCIKEWLKNNTGCPSCRVTRTQNLR